MGSNKYNLPRVNCLEARKTILRSTEILYKAGDGTR